MDSPKPHNFADSLAQSHAADELPLWRDLYQRAFPGFLEMINFRADGEHQRAGVDRGIYLQNCKEILVDEKVRGRNKRTGRVYEDISLEYWSDKESRKPGWVCKPLRCDYIAYAIAPLGKCYLLPVPAMQNAWLVYGDEWVSKYNFREAPNKYNGRTWTTIFCPVPVRELYQAMGDMLRLTFEPFEYNE
jgi:hypothetical protein